MNARTFGLIVLSLALPPALAAAQAPPTSKPQPAPPVTSSQAPHVSRPKFLCYVRWVLNRCWWMCSMPRS